MTLLKTRVLQVVGLATALILIAPLSAEAGTNRAAPAERPFHQQECDDVADISADVRACTFFFFHTGTIETFVVPPTTGPVDITAVGAPGAGERGLWSYGATVTGSFNLPTGTPLFVAVGGEGWLDRYNGGGPGGGGGASDVRLGVPDLKHRIIVAGGGGGWGQQLVDDKDSGTQRLVMVKGGDAGQAGLGSGGQPGTPTEGGAGGGSHRAQGQAGRLGRGGGGADGFGGGGGGLYGGGGGAGCSGIVGHSLCVLSQPGSGGGGSSLVPRGGTIAVTPDLNPHVTITLTQPAASLWLPWPRLPLRDDPFPPYVANPLQPSKAPRVIMSSSQGAGPPSGGARGASSGSGSRPLLSTQIVARPGGW
jgi:Glycine rich protein